MESTRAYSREWISPGVRALEDGWAGLEKKIFFQEFFDVDHFYLKSLLNLTMQRLLYGLGFLAMRHVEF